MSGAYPTIAPMSQADLKDTLGIGANDTNDDRLLNDMAGGLTRAIEELTGPVIKRPPVTVECEHVWEDLALLPDFQCPGEVSTLPGQEGRVEEYTGTEWVEVTDYRTPPAHGSHTTDTKSGWLYRTDTRLRPICWATQQPGAVRVVNWIPGRFDNTTQAAELEDGMAVVSAFEIVAKHNWSSWVAFAQTTNIGEYDQIRPIWPGFAIPAQAKQILAGVSKSKPLMAGARHL